MGSFMYTYTRFSQKPEISEVADRPKIQLQQNYFQADTLIQYLLSEPRSDAGLPMIIPDTSRSFWFTQILILRKFDFCHF